MSARNGTDLMLEYIIGPAINAIFAIAFGLIWMRNKTMPAAGLWAAAYFFAFASWGLEAIYIPLDLMHVLGPAADTAYFLFVSLIAVGLAVRYERKVPFIALGVLLMGNLIVNYWHWFAAGNHTMRLQYLCFGMTAFFMISAWIVYPLRRHQPTRLLLYVLGACIISGLLSSFALIYADDFLIDTASYDNSFFLNLSRIISPIASISLALTLLLDLAATEFQRLNKQAQTDPLTNLLNRRAFEEKAKDIRAKASPAALIICDIDHFKTVNDTYGHAHGDKIIQEFANILKAGCRETDQIGRIGGEEFGILLPNASVGAAHLIAENLKSCLARYRSPHLPQKQLISASFGVAALGKSESYESAFTHADKALYLAKKDGRGCVRSHLAVPDRKRMLLTHA